MFFHGSNNIKDFLGQLPISKPILERLGPYLCPLPRTQIRGLAVGGFQISAIGFGPGHYVGHFGILFETDTAICSARLHAVQQVAQHLVGHLFGRGEVDAKEIGHPAPEPLQSLSDAPDALHGRQLGRHYAVARKSLALCLAQPLCTTAAAVMRQHLVGYFVIRRQLRIAGSDAVPDARAFHQLHHVLPFGRIGLPESRRPQVRILVYRGFGRGYPRVHIYPAAHGEAVGLAARCAEIPHIALPAVETLRQWYHIAFVVIGHGIRRLYNRMIVAKNAGMSKQWFPVRSIQSSIEAFNNIFFPVIENPICTIVLFYKT